MCFNVSTKVKRSLKNEHNDGFRLVDESETFAGYEHPDLPATLSQAQNDPVPLQWGLVPWWAKTLGQARELQSSGRLARCETLFERAMFRDAASNQRCLVWLDGFYEWQHVGKGKKKILYHVHFADNRLFAVGSLWNRWRNPAGSELLQTCAFVTTPANELMAEIHNTKQRMPLILPEAAQCDWLNPDFPREAVLQLAQPLPDGLLVAEPVADAPSPRDEGPAPGLLF